MGIAPNNYTLPAPPAGERANTVLTGAFAATGQSASFMCVGAFNVVIYGPSGPNGNWNGTVELERSFDGGTTWIVCGVGGSGQQAKYTSAGTGSDVSIVVGEPEQGVVYRLNCTAWTSGPINYRFSTTGGAAMSLAVATNIP